MSSTSTGSSSGESPTNSLVEDIRIAGSVVQPSVVEPDVYIKDLFQDEPLCKRPRKV